MLQQPAMLFLNQDAVRKGLKIQSLEGPTPLNDISETNVKLLSAVLNQFSDKHRLTVYPLCAFFIQSSILEQITDFCCIVSVAGSCGIVVGGKK